MKAVKEITQWDWEHQPNHIYLLDGDKALAYIPKGKKDAVYFSVPLRMNLRFRKFEDLNRNPFNTANIDAPVTIKVVGSNGKLYEVDPKAKTCTCPGFTFRCVCKHVKELP